MIKRYQLRGSAGPVTNRVIELMELDMTLGRDLSNDIVISDSEVSRAHARLIWQGDGYAIQDLRSTNGTWINGRPALRSSRLTAGDLVTLGKVSVFVYELIPEPVADTTQDEDAPEPPQLIESTMAMPAWQEKAPEAREIAKVRSAGAQLRPDEASPGSGGLIPPAVQGGQPFPGMKLSAGTLFHQRYVACLQTGDLVGLLSLYHSGATLLSVDGGVTGAEGIAGFFEHYFGGLGCFKAGATGKYVEGPDSILCETSIETADEGRGLAKIARVHDVFVLRDGKATHQFTCTVE